MAQLILGRFLKLALLLGLLLCISSIALAQTYPIGNISDMKPGSVLFFNRYTSNPAGGGTGDTQINITNVNTAADASIHLFFIDASTCSVADFGLSLTPNQTVKFLTSELDPGVQGYVVAVATDGVTPTQFNSLIGTAYIRENDGRQAILQAISLAKISEGSIAAKLDGTYSLLFNGLEYERLPNSVAVASFNSEVTDSNTLIIYSPTNNLVLGSVASVSVFTLLYDDAERSLSSSFSVRCYRVDSFRTLFNRLGGITGHVPAGTSGWIKMTSASSPLLGSVITSGPVFAGGFNLHALTLLPSYEITIPVF
jgi:hypothetical protein